MSELLQLIQKTLTEKLGEDIVTIDMRNVSAFTDYFVIATARSQRHAASLAEEIVQTAEKHGYPIRDYEGREGSAWILVDLNDVIVHIFTAEGRDAYQLEQLWADQPQERLEEKEK